MTEHTLLLRQIHPTFIQKGIVSSQAFRPTEEDLKLSVYDGDLIEPEPAWKHYTTELQKESAAVLAVSVAECASLDLPASPSPEVFREHCDIDFTGLAPRKIESKGRLLRDRAVIRGFLFQAMA